MPGLPILCGILSTFSIVHAAGSAIGRRPHLAAHARAAVRQLIDAQLHAIPLVGVPRERHAHGHFVGRLPRMQLELLAVAEQHEAVALVDQADVAALAALLAAAHVALRPCSRSCSAGPGTPSRGGRRYRRADASAPCRRLRRCAGTPCPARRSTTPAALPPRRSRNQTSTAAVRRRARAPCRSGRRPSPSRIRRSIPAPPPCRRPSHPPRRSTDRPTTAPPARRE